MMDIGKRIAQLRELNNIKAKDLADQAGITKVYLSYIEHGTKKPTLDMLEKICSALGVTMPEFFSESDISPELQKLLSTAKNLSPEKLEALNEFIKKTL